MIIRDKQGIHIATVSEITGIKMINGGFGKWRPYKSNKGTVSAYEVTEPCKYTIGAGPTELQMMLWEGYVFLPNGM